MSNLSLLAQQVAKSRADARAMGLVQMHEVEKVLATRCIRDVVERDYEHLCASRPGLPDTFGEHNYLHPEEVKKSIVLWRVCLDTLLGEEPLICSDFHGRITHILHPFKEQLS